MADFSKEALVLEHIERAAKHVASDAYEGYKGDMTGGLGNNTLRRFDSPLEAVFWLWWVAVCQEHDRFANTLELIGQYPVTVNGQDYRFDFVVRPGYDPMFPWSDYVVKHWPLVGIELDGHTWHEKTLEQVTYRNQRDRALQQAGWHIFHYSFSEFTNDPDAKVVEIVDFLRDRAWRLTSTDRELKEQAKQAVKPESSEA